jgi:hypothetical protein
MPNSSELLDDDDDLMGNESLTPSSPLTLSSIRSLSAEEQQQQRPAGYRIRV